MKRRVTQQEWERDLVLRQRSVVFPETASNEARFWRNIISGRQKLGITQIIGIALIYAGVGAVLYSLVSIQMRASEIKGTMWDRIMGNFGSWIILLLIFGLVLLIGQLVSRRSERKRGLSQR